MSNTHSGGGIQHSPPIAVELGEGMQIDVSVVNAHMPAENCSIEPHIAMCELHAFRASRCSRGVVNRCRRVFIWFPCDGLDVITHQLVIGFRSDDPFHLTFDILHCLFKFGVNEQNAGAGVLDDVRHLFSNKPEVDRDKNST